ncbi:MAG: hypothetical protein KBT47_08300, partial [Armatimonadetes bacterium]|nr:hypothetical protein [Candidatus Hippobium faecium]
VWLWDKYEGIDEIINTFRSVCHRLEEFPDLKFSGSSISFYQWVKEFDPNLFEKIKEYIKQGRWEVVGGWLVENDCNLPLSASFYNSAEISKKFMDEELKTSTSVAYSPDTFGHPASLPSILAETGFKYYVFCRPCETEKTDLPQNLFYWEHKGNKVLAYRLKYHYSSGGNCSKELIKQHITDESLYINNTACYFFGCGDHGGGPTIQEIKWIKELQEELKDEIEITFNTCKEFYEYAEKLENIPTYSGDLHYHAIGCYSVNRNIKDNIRNSERALDYTRRVYDNTNKDVDLSGLWAKVAFNEFHDIMPGSCSPDAARQAINELGGVQDNADMLCYQALKAISAGIPLKCRQGEFRIYNSLPYDVKTPLEFESSMYYKPNMPFLRQDGTPITYQEIRATTDFNRRMVFTDTIPAKSMASYYFDCSEDNALNTSIEQLWQSGMEIEANGLKIDSNLNIYTKDGKFFKSPIRLAVLRDCSDTWSHNIPGYNEGAEGYFRFVSSSVHDGPIYSAILTKWEYKKSIAEIEIDLYKNEPFMDIKVMVNMNEDFKVIKMLFEDTEKIEKHIAQGPGASIEKTTNHCEEPLHTWIRFGSKTLLQKGAFAYSRDNSTISITLVRSNLYGWHTAPCGASVNSPLWHTDRGEHRFSFRIFTKEITEEETEKQSQIFVEPFKVMRENN